MDRDGSLFAAAEDADHGSQLLPPVDARERAVDRGFATGLPDRDGSPVPDGAGETVGDGHVLPVRPISADASDAGFLAGVIWTGREFLGHDENYVIRVSVTRVALGVNQN